MQKSHIKTQELPPVPDATNPLSLTKDDYYSELEDPDNTTTNNHDVKITQDETSSDGYTLLAKEGDESGDPGYDTAYSHYEMSDDPALSGGSGGRKMGDDDDHDYEEPYWEPATMEEELMDQLAKLNVPVIPVKNIE